MSDDIFKRQKAIDSIFAAAALPGDVSDQAAFVARLLELAHRGLVAPESFSDEDIMLVCKTLIFKFAQEGQH